MRILIDLQAAQSLGSRDRGIGRYSLALVQAIARQKGQHEILLALNGAFPETIEPLMKALEGLVERRNIHVWHSLPSVASHDADHAWRRKSAQLLREAFLMSLQPDVTLVCSLFEGLSDDAITSIHEFSDNALTAVVLYDLIPLLHRERYLQNPIVATWYLEKIEYLRKAHLCLAISQSSQNEAIAHLHFQSTQVSSISSDVGPQFQPQAISEEKASSLRAQYGLKRPFVMYTGGIDYRKNIERLITAFAMLPSSIRGGYQLAIVCSVPAAERLRLERLIASEGLASDEVVMTGYVSDEDLVSLYNLCTLFVFPSLHEGFGLPALEAMRCGAPVIASNTSSLPEVVGLQEALFNPFSEHEMSKALERGLTDLAFRERLIAHGHIQSQQFSWDESGRLAIAAMEQLWADQSQKEGSRLPVARPRLAFVSPLPPERSGIADYSAQLLPHLALFYDIDVVLDQAVLSDSWVLEHCPVKTTQEFIDTYQQYDRVLYHFGNSTFHQHMLALLRWAPGVVVMHDFYLSGLLRHLEIENPASHIWSQELYASHGYSVLYERFHTGDSERVMWRYPCNGSVVQNSLGIIAHSQESASLALQWYRAFDPRWQVIPLMREKSNTNDQAAVRTALGLGDNDFVVCSFGMVGTTKLCHRLIKAWLDSPLAQNPGCKLIFVGEVSSPSYYAQLMELMDGADIASSISFTQWVDSKAYEQYLSVANAAVQLRSQSRGETSAAVLDCMNFGIPTIINAHGSMAEIDDGAVLKLADQFSDADLAQALTVLWQDLPRAQEIAKAGLKLIAQWHQPAFCAQRYYEVIEQCYAATSDLVNPLIVKVSQLRDQPTQTELIALAQAIDKSLPQTPLHHQLLIDVTALANGARHLPQDPKTLAFLRSMLLHPPVGYRVEPVYWDSKGAYQYARAFTLDLLDCPKKVLTEQPASYQAGDVFLDLSSLTPRDATHRSAVLDLRNTGVILVLGLVDWPQFVKVLPSKAATGIGDNAWLSQLAMYDVLLCGSAQEAQTLEEQMATFALLGDQAVSPQIDWIFYDNERSPSDNASSSAVSQTSSMDAQSEMNGAIEKRSFEGFLERQHDSIGQPYFNPRH